jgi:hypothetical protein
MDLDNNRKLIAAALAAVGSGDRRALQAVYRLTATKRSACWLVRNAPRPRSASRAIVLLPPWSRRGKNGLRPGQRNSR